MAICSFAAGAIDNTRTRIDIWVPYELVGISGILQEVTINGAPVITKVYVNHPNANNIGTYTRVLLSCTLSTTVHWAITCLIDLKIIHSTLYNDNNACW